MEDPSAAYDTMDDTHLAALAQNGDATAMETVLARYKGLVRRKAVDVFLVGGDTEDVVQEGMIGLFKAVRTYRPEHGVPFSTFAAYCVSSRITDAVRTATRHKHSPLNDSLSLQRMADDEDGSDRLDVFQDTAREDPEQLLLGREAYESLRAFLEATLTDLERKSVLLMMEGMSYREVAARLGRSVKAIDNALRRARAKFGKRLRGG